MFGQYMLMHVSVPVPSSEDQMNIGKSITMVAIENTCSASYRAHGASRPLHGSMAREYSVSVEFMVITTVIDTCRVLYLGGRIYLPHTYCIHIHLMY